MSVHTHQTRRAKKQAALNEILMHHTRILTQCVQAINALGERVEALEAMMMCTPTPSVSQQFKAGRISSTDEYREEPHGK